MTAAREQRRGVLLIAAAALFWSTGGIGVKAISETAIQIACYRSAIAAVALIIVFRPRVWRWSVPFLAAIVSYAACLTTFVIATKWTTAANAIFLQYSGVVWVLLLSPLVLKEPLKRRDVAATIIALGGMVLFFLGRFEVRGMAGNFTALLSGVFFAGLVLSLRAERGAAAEAAVTWGNVLAALALLPFALRDGGVAPSSFAGLAWLGLFQIALAYVLFVRGLHHVSATQASITGMLEPVANPIWVFLFLGERPAPLAVVGAIIVLAAIGWRTMTADPEAAATPELPPPD